MITFYMYKIKIFLKTSIKKLKKLSKFKGNKLFPFLNYLIKERNKHLDIVYKKMLCFLNIMKKMSNSQYIYNDLVNSIYIYSISFYPSKKLKRLNFRAKGKTDIIEKRNSFIIITLHNQDLIKSKS